MRYRRFGSSDLVVSEVGLRHVDARLRLVGPHRRPARHDPRRARRRHQLHRHRARVRRRRRGRDASCATYLAARDDIVLTTKCRLRHRRRAQVPRPVGAAARLATGVGPPAVRGLAAPARHRPHRPLPAAQPAHRADPRRRPLGDARRPQDAKARCASSASRSVRRSDGSRKATARSTTARSSSLQTVFNVLEQEPGRTFAAATARRSSGEVEPDLARAARVRHALGQGRRPTPCSTRRTTASHRNRDNMLDNFEKAETLVVPVGAGDRPHDRAGRDRGILANPAFTTRAADACSSVDDVREYAGRVRPPAHRRRARATSTRLWSRNFDHEDRYVMPLKSSV